MPRTVIDEAPTAARAERGLVADHELERDLGSGFLGETYLVRCGEASARGGRASRPRGAKLGDHGVLKLLHPRHEPAASSIAELSALTHPNLASPFASGVDEETGRRYIVRPWLSGVDWVAAARLSGPEGIPILLAPVCRALAHLHDHGRCHGRLHENNARVFRVAAETAPRVVLCDFGLVHASGRTALDIDFEALGRMILRALVPEPEMPAGEDLSRDEVERMLRVHVDPASPPLAYVARRCLGLDDTGRFHSAIEILDEVNRRAGLDLTIQAPELRRPLNFDGRMVGRQRELDRLKMRLEALTGGSLGIPIAPLAVLVGESGIGKSRLLREFTTHAAKKKLWILSGVCREEVRHPYAPLEDALTALAGCLQSIRQREGLPAADPHPLLVRYGPELVKVCPQMGRGFGFAPSQALEPEQEKMRLIDQVSFFVHDASRHAPILIAVEDLHWADEGTLDLLRYLSRVGQSGSVQVLATARREAVADSLLKRVIDEGSGEGWLEQILLDALSQEQLRDLGAEVLQLKGDSAAPALERISREAEGSPYQLQEILCHLVEVGALRQIEGKWEFSSERVGSIQIPRKIAEAYLERIQRLDGASLELLRLLATFGRPASVDQLARMLGHPRWELQKQVEALVDRAILERLPSQEAVLYVFRHARQRDPLYEGIPPAERPALHARVVAELRSLASGDDARHQAELTRHLLAAGSIHDAFTTGLPAIQELLKQNAPHEALALASALGQHLDEANDPANVCRLVNCEGNAYKRLGERALANNKHQEALELSRRYEVKEEEITALIGIAWMGIWTRNPESWTKGLNAAREAYSLLCQRKDIPLIVQLLSAWAGYYLSPDQLHIADRMLKRSIEMAALGSPPTSPVHALINRGIVACLQGHLSAGRQFLNQALALSESHKDVCSVPYILTNLCFVASASGDIKLAKRYLERPELNSRGIVDRILLLTLEHEHAEILARQGKVAPAIDLLKGLDSRLETISLPNLSVATKLELASLLIFLGILGDAEMLVEELEKECVGKWKTERECERHVLQARLARVKGNFSESFEHLRTSRLRAQQNRNRRNEALVLYEMSFLAYAGVGGIDAEEVQETLFQIAHEGESFVELVSANLTAVRRLRGTGNSHAARKLAGEAYSIAEQRELGVWQARTLGEGILVDLAAGDSQEARRKKRLLDEWISDVQKSLARLDGVTASPRGEFGELIQLSANVPITASQHSGGTRGKPDAVRGCREPEGSFEEGERILESEGQRPLYVGLISDGQCRLECLSNERDEAERELVAEAFKRSMNGVGTVKRSEGLSDTEEFWLKLDVAGQSRWRVAADFRGGIVIGRIYRIGRVPHSTASMKGQRTQSRAKNGDVAEPVEWNGASVSSGSWGDRTAQGGDDNLLIGRSVGIRQVMNRVRIAARGDLSVLIQGESGTGKELVARRIHRLGTRAARPFLAVDCGAIPENLIESELFGYRRGAFTGADRDKPGVFEEVDGGTLMLDEIGNAGTNFQAKLLRVLQEGEVRSIGENKARRVDVRILAATNVDLRRGVESGTFREDLFYRLSVITIEVPPLRERREDVPLLVQAFLEEMKAKGQNVGSLSGETLEILTEYEWPGNVRELRNVLQAAALAADGAVITPSHLPEEVLGRSRGESVPARVVSQEGKVENVGEKRKIEEVLIQVLGDKTATCRILGWNRMKLYRRMRRYGIPLDFGKSS